MASFDQTWEKIHASQEWGKYPSEPVIRFVARNYYAKDRKQIKILDFGCGGGSNTWYLAREGFDTYAFDGAKSAIRRVRERLEAEDLQADLRVRDALALDYGEDVFDCVIDNVTVYANVKRNIEEMYRKIYTMLKKGGKVFSVCFSTETTGFGLGTKIEENTFCDISEGSLAGRGVAHFFTREELIETFEAAGFRDIVIDTLQFTDRGCCVGQFLVQAVK